LSSWDEWLDELEKQNLVIEVNDDPPGSLSKDFRLVSRSQGGAQTTDAARQPANITIQSPTPADRN
jgi:hypothetical protein